MCYFRNIHKVSEFDHSLAHFCENFSYLTKKFETAMFLVCFSAVSAAIDNLSDGSNPCGTWQERYP